MPGLRLAAIAAVAGAVRTHADGVEREPLRLERAQHEVLRSFEIGQRKARRAQTILVRHHHQAIARVHQLAKRGEHAGHEADLVETVHLLVGRLLDQRAVAIDEQHLQRRGAHARLPSRRSFCSRVPIGDAQRLRQQRLAHVADDEADAAHACEHVVRGRRVHQQEVRVAGPHARNQRRRGERAGRRVAVRPSASAMRRFIAAMPAGASSGATTSTVSSGDRIGRDHLARERDDLRCREQRAASRAARGRATSTACAARRGSAGSRSLRPAKVCPRTRCRPRRRRATREGRGGARGPACDRDRSRSPWDCSASRRTPGASTRSRARGSPRRRARSLGPASSGTATTSAPWMRAATPYMPNVGGQTMTLSFCARQKMRHSRSMASSLPRPTSNCDGGTPYSDASPCTSAGGCGSG